MSKATQETEHLKEMLVGNILAVTWPELARTALLYAVVGAFHYLFRRQFLLISVSEGEAERRGLSIRLWDLLFYISFGFVVTSSVAIAGVLLVFCFLIVPSVTAMLFTDRLGPRLAIGWGMGALVSAGGVLLSFLLDLPTGATIVATFGAVLLLVVLFRPLAGRGRVIEDARSAGRPPFPRSSSDAGSRSRMILSSRDSYFRPTRASFPRRSSLARASQRDGR
jgi:zinc/manganese transport system permease protein